MMRGIINSSISFRFLVVIIAAVLLVFGINQMANMPVDMMPEISPPYVEIQTEALGLSAKEVEQMITMPMEQDLLAGVAWLDVIRSESVPGLSSVLIYFEPGTDLFQARQMVAERLSQAAVGLPHVSKPPTMIQPLSTASRFMIVGLSSSELSLIQMSVLARWTIAPRLMGVPGVAHVSVWGNRDRQLQVQVDPDRLRARNVTLEQVVETTGNALWVSSLSYLEASTPGTGGFIDTPNQRLSIWHVLPITSAEELAQVPIEGTKSLLLSDIADVVEDHQPLIGDAVVNDNPNLMLVVEKLPGTNTLQVTRDVERALDLIRPGFTAIDFDASIFRPATFIEMAIANLTQTLVIAAILILVLLGLFLYSWRAVLVGLASIAFSMVAALYVLYLRGETLNAMVLAGLVVALGVIIDEAVVESDIIVRRLIQNRHMEEPLSTVEVVRESLAEVHGSTIFSTLIMLLLVVPIFFIRGVTGSLYQATAVSYLLAVLAALVTGLIVIPAFSLIFFANNQPVKRFSPISVWFTNSYSRFVLRSLSKPNAIFAIAIILVLVVAVSVPLFGYPQELPTMREPYVQVSLEAAPGTSHQAMDRIVSLVSSDLRSIPGVLNVGAHVGRAVFGDQVVGINSAQLWVQIASDGNYTSTVGAIEDLTSGYTGVKMDVHTYTDQVLNQPHFTTSETMTLRVFGEEQDVLRSEAEKLQSLIASIEGVSDAQVIYPAVEPTIEIEVNLPVAQKYGIKPGDVRRTAASLFSGIQVGSLFEEQKIFDVVVWSTPETRDSISDIRNLMIDTPSGGQVRLGELADVRMVASPTVIKREAVSPYMDVYFTVAARDAQAVVTEINATLQNYLFPLEYHAEVMGDYSSRLLSQQQLLISGLVVLIGIFLLVQAATRNWRLAIALLLSLPAAVSGGILATVISGKQISLLSMFGMLAIVGICLRSVILLINRCQALAKKGEITTELVVLGSSERFTPWLMTLLMTASVFMLIIIFGNAPGHEILLPIAVSAVGSLVTTTLYILLIVPALYLRFGTYQESELELTQEPVPNYG
ncbi:MAG: efflux RND transporter permease subunit [Chloroflexi bacterium]|nr:MAG: efflux RND transporter permease subunit [Chloroflexota bacterium]